MRIQIQSEGGVDPLTPGELNELARGLCLSFPQQIRASVGNPAKLGQLGYGESGTAGFVMEIVQAGAVAAVLRGALAVVVQALKNRAEKIRIKTSHSELEFPLDASPHVLASVIDRLTTGEGEEKVQPLPLAETIRLVARNVTGLRLDGVVEEVQRGGEISHRIMFADGFVHCLQRSEGWLFTHFGQNNSMRGMWSTVATAGTRAGQDFISQLLVDPTASKSVNFLMSEMGATQDETQRFRYQSDVGDIVLHSRTHPLGTEMVVEFIMLRRYCRFVRDKKLGTLVSSETQELQAVPF